MIFRLFWRGFAEVVLHPWRSAAPLLTIALAAFLAGLFLLLLHNVEREIVKQRGRTQFTVYWNPSADMKLVQAQWDSFVKLDGLKDATTYTPDQGLEALSKALGGKVDLAWLRGKSPLPPTATLHFAPPPSPAPDGFEGIDGIGWFGRLRELANLAELGGLFGLDAPQAPDAKGAKGASVEKSDPAWGKAMYERLKGLPEVREVHYNPLQVDMARSWLGLAKRCLWPAAAALSFLAACIVGNAVRLTQHRRREEIDILRLAGATSWYVRAPLLASGLTMALLGSGLALGALKLMQQYLERVLDAAPLWIRVEYMPLEQVGVLAGGILLFALVSSWMAAKD